MKIYAAVIAFVAIVVVFGPLVYVLKRREY